MMTKLIILSIMPLLLLAALFNVAYADTSPCPYVWGRALHVGDSGADVFQLQKFLNSDPATQVANSGVGSPGNESSTYGVGTKRAVLKFQQVYASSILSPAGLTQPTGSVGKRTLQELNQLCSSASTSTAASSSTSSASTDELTITASDQPASGLIPSGAGGVPFITLTLTAGSKDVTVNDITVERVGLGEDDAFQNIALNDPNSMQIGIAPSFGSDHKAQLEQPFTISAGQSETLTIVANMASDLTDFAGEIPQLQVDAITASSPVVGTLPLRSNPQTLNASLTIGSVTVALSSFDPDGNETHYINDKGIIFSGVRLTANSTEDVTLSSIIWNQSGTAGPDDLANVATVVNGSSTPAVTTDGKNYVSVFSPAIVIPKGQSVDLYVEGDLTATGANRTVEFDIYNNSNDVSLTGNTFGFGVGISPSGNTAESGHSVFITSDGTPDGDTGTPFFSGSVITIDPGSLISIHS